MAKLHVPAGAPLNASAPSALASIGARVGGFANALLLAGHPFVASLPQVSEAAVAVDALWLELAGSSSCSDQVAQAFPLRDGSVRYSEDWPASGRIETRASAVLRSLRECCVARH